MEIVSSLAHMKTLSTLIFALLLWGSLASAQEHYPCDQHDHSKDKFTAKDSLRFTALENDANALREEIALMEKLDVKALPEALKAFTTKYKSLREKASTLPVIAELIKIADYDRVVALANRLRYIALGVYYIEESRAAHPWGPYGALHNCKHQ